MEKAFSSGIIVSVNGCKSYLKILPCNLYVFLVVLNENSDGIKDIFLKD